MNQDFFNDREGGRDGYTPRNEGNANDGQSHYGNGGRAPRQRFTRNPRPAGNSNYGNGGGYGSSREGGYRPRYGQGEGGYQPRGGYQNRGGYGQREGGYRPRYEQNEGGYQSHGKPHYGQGGGYRPRYEQGEGGYQPRSYQGSPRQGGYGQPRGGQGGYRPHYQGQGSAQYGRPGARRNGFDGGQRFAQKKRVEYKEEAYDPTVPVRLNKFLSNAGVCSRRDADKYIEAGVVSVNGVTVTELGSKVLRTDVVKFHDNVVKMEKKVYVLLNKPKGYVTSSEDPQNRKTVMDLVSRACQERIYPVGRLDRNTTGVLLLTNDGEMSSKLTHPKFLKKKIYHVTTDQNVSAEDLKRIAEGITLEDGEIKADAIEYADAEDKKQIGIEIHSGRNRIVRRIFESLGYHVIKLDRVYFAGLTKKGVRRGDWRYLTEREVEILRMGSFE